MPGVMVGRQKKLLVIGLGAANSNSHYNLFIVLMRDTAAVSSFNPDCSLGSKRCDLPESVRPELVEGLGFPVCAVRQAHHERANEQSGFNTAIPRQA